MAFPKSAQDKFSTPPLTLHAGEVYKSYLENPWKKNAKITKTAEHNKRIIKKLSNGLRFKLCLNPSRSFNQTNNSLLLKLSNNENISH